MVFDGEEVLLYYIGYLVVRLYMIWSLFVLRINVLRINDVISRLFMYVMIRCDL